MSITIDGISIDIIKEIPLSFSAVLEEATLDSGQPHIMPLGVSSVAFKLLIRTGDNYLSLFSSLRAKAEAGQTITVSGFSNSKYNGTYYVDSVEHVQDFGFADMSITLRKLTI